MPSHDPPTELSAAWEAAREQLRRSLPETTFRMWLEPLRFASSRTDTLILTAPEKIRAWVERRYLPLIARFLAAAAGRPVTVTLEDPASAVPTREAPAPAQLNPSYTFERFVIGEANQLAHAAALSVAEAPAEAYNPLFIHGPPGLGKTHLLSAIANYLTLHTDALTVRYTTAEGFTSEFVTALKTSGVESFKRRYRDLDVLLVDDVQFLEGKQSTEEEFFHTFNALYESGSQLVLSADRLPSELSTLAERLRDRFEWGLIVPISHPTLATRQTVLERLVREADIEIGDRATLTALAQRVDTNIRQLHGALTRLIAHSSLTSKPLDPELVDAVLGHPRQGRSRAGSASVEDLQRLAADSFGLTPEQVRGPARSAPAVRARQLAILLTRELTDHSLPEIGRRFGGRDHSTIHNSLRRAESLLETDPEFSAQLNSLRERVHNEPADRA